MATMKYQTFEFPNNPKGQKQKIKKIYDMKAQGWKIDREDIIPSSFNACTGFILLIICFPLVLFGYTTGKIVITFVPDDTF